jgi:hypothetical protein
MASARTSSTTGSRSRRNCGSSVSEVSAMPARLPVQRRTLWAQAVDLLAPRLILDIDAGRSNDEEVDVASRATVAASRAAKERRVNRRHGPGTDGLSQPADELFARSGHLLHGRQQQILPVEHVHERTTRLRPFDQSMFHQSIMDVLHAGI